MGTSTAGQYDEGVRCSLRLVRDYGREVRRALIGSPPPALPYGAPVHVTLVLRNPRGRLSRTPRRFASPRSVEAALRSLPDVIVDVVDFARLPLDAQTRRAAQTEILVGAHGAGLAHVLTMADHGALVEVVAAPAAATYRLYPNLAAWTGRSCRRVEAPGRWAWGGRRLLPDLDGLTRTVRALADDVRDRRPRAGTSAAG
jgi:hypothetical protein